jgi:hypothetical protein
MTAACFAVDVCSSLNRRANHAVYRLVKASNERDHRTFTMVRAQVARGRLLHILSRL